MALSLGNNTRPSFTDELSRLARFGANISDAYSCFIFLPEKILRAHVGNRFVSNSNQDLIHLAGFHSLSNDVITDSALATDSGLIGWVAKHGRSIHVSPFERDSRTLGTYTTDQQLKSFIGIPVGLDRDPSDSSQLSGVIACDSRKAFAFSKLQGKLLDELAEQVAAVVRLCQQNLSKSSHTDWHRFRELANELSLALGIGAIDAIRVRIKNLFAIESRLGVLGVTELVEQMIRLVLQALPPHTPLIQLPNGDLILLTDNMMSSFYESRIAAIGDHLHGAAGKIELEFFRSARKKRRIEPLTIDTLIAETTPAIELSTQVTNQLKGQSTLLEKVAYEFRRA